MSEPAPHRLRLSRIGPNKKAADEELREAFMRTRRALTGTDSAESAEGLFALFKRLLPSCAAKGEDRDERR